MPTIRISVPFAVDLTKEEGWRPSDKNTFSIVRAHFQLRERQADDSIRMGDKLAVIESPIGVKQEHVRSMTTELTSVQFRESFQESMRQDESLQEFAATIASELGATGVGKISSELKASAQSKLAESFRESYRIRDVVTKRVEETYELKHTVDPAVTARLVAVAAYQKYAYDLTLAWVDYLSVRYRSTAMGLRKRRTKRPSGTGPRPFNWLRFNLPLATAHFWKPLPKSSLIVKEDDYRHEVQDPEEIELRPPEDLHQYVAPRPDVATLYQLSNVAFPLKWIHRKGDWTEDDLKRIEEEEAAGSAWFWTYGPGRKSDTDGSPRGSD